MKTRNTVKVFTYGRDFLCILPSVLAALLIFGLISAAHAAPEGGVVRAGSAQIKEQGKTTLIQQSSSRAIIDWRKFGINSDERVQFAQPSVRSATLNRVTGDQVSFILGRLDANGQVLLVNPNGIIFGKSAQINVGSLIASTANISNNNFLQGKLVFDKPGRPGAEIINTGSITAAEGGLIALVAPHVRNDGLIQARLGKVILGAADTFTIDLYGDGLINLALSEASLAALKDGQGKPVKDLISQAGTIDVGSGQTVLMTAEVAKGLLDSLINMSGVVLADSAVQEGGRILLLARSGNVDVSGNLSAEGTTGGQIDVLGDQVHLFSTATLDANGVYGGGVLHVGGDYQGSGDTYRAQSTKINAGATLNASALTRGNGGEVVVWSDSETSYEGSILARGGEESGDGGLVEVSGKQTLLFDGSVDAGASNGKAGSLLLDPYNFTIGMTEASLISRVLRTGTSTSVSADNDLYVNYVIDGRGRYTGGGLTLSAGNDVNVNDYIITNNGAINLFAEAGTVNLATGKVVYAGTAPLTVRSGGTLTNASYLTGGRLSLTSTQGSVNIDQGIDSSIGGLLIQAAGDVNVNEPIVSLSDGNKVSVSADNDINVNAQIDGRPALGSNPNGSVTMTAGQDIYLNKSILAGSINLTANLGTMYAPTMTSGQVTLDANGIPLGDGLFAGTGPISVTTGGNLSNGIYVTTGPVSIRSTGGNVTVDTKLAEILGNVAIKSDTGSVNIDEEIANIRSGSNLTITAGTDINLNKQIDALDDSNPLSITPVPGGSVTLAAARDVQIKDHLVTNNGAVSITGDRTVIQQSDGVDAYGAPLTKQVRAGNAAISVTSGSDLSLGSLVTTGVLNVTSTEGNVSIGVPVYETTGKTTVTAARDININQIVANTTTGSDLTMTSMEGNINVDAKVGPWDRETGETLNRDAVPGGSITLSAYGDINVNKDILSYKAALTDEDAAVIRLTGGTSQVAGTVDLADGIKVMSDSGAIHAVAYGNLDNGPYINDNPDDSVVNGTPTTGYFTTGPLNLTSTAGSLTINQSIPDTIGEVTLQAGNAITVNQRIYSNNGDISLFAGPGGIVMSLAPDPNPVGTGFLSDIDAREGNLTLVAEGNIYPSSLRTQGILEVKSTDGVISGGQVMRSRESEMYPELIELAGSLGINNFTTEFSPVIKAISNRGSIEELNVYTPVLLEVIAHDNIVVSGILGYEPKLYAGGNIENASGIAWAGNVTEKAGVNITVGSFYNLTSTGEDYFSYIVGSLDLSAGMNPFTTFGNDYEIAGVYVAPLKDSWTSAGPGNISVSDRTWIEGEGGLTASATGTISMLDDVHISYSLMPAENTTDPKQEQQPLSLTAGGNIILPERIETMGPVTLISTNGDVNIGQTIGSHVSEETPESHLWNPYDKGVASLEITANNGNISMQEARAEGNITIQAYGDGITTGLVTAGPGIESVSGTSLVQGTVYNTPISNAIVDRLPYPTYAVPAYSPGPTIAGPAAPPQPGALPPGAPIALTALPAQTPDVANVAGSDIPSVAGGGAPEQEIEPERAISTGSLSEIIPEEDEDNDEEGKKILKFSGGRGVSRTAVTNEILETFITSPFIPRFSQRR